MTRKFGGPALLSLVLVTMLGSWASAQQDGFGPGQDAGGYGPGQGPAGGFGQGRQAGQYNLTQQQVNYNLSRYFYYPYVYFPHNYWPQQGPRWPEPPGAPPMKAPAYMAYPAFREPHWRYELFEPQRYYRGFHFWLDQF